MTETSFRLERQRRLFQGGNALNESPVMRRNYLCQPLFTLLLRLSKGKNFVYKREKTVVGNEGTEIAGSRIL